MHPNGGIPESSGGGQVSESNRRPSHYEEELRRRIGSLPAVWVTRPHAGRARFPMSIRDFVPRVMPRMSTTVGAAAARRRHREPPRTAPRLTVRTLRLTSPYLGQHLTEEPGYVAAAEDQLPIEQPIAGFAR